MDSRLLAGCFGPRAKRIGGLPPDEEEEGRAGRVSRLLGCGLLATERVLKSTRAGPL